VSAGVTNSSSSSSLYCSLSQLAHHHNSLFFNDDYYDDCSLRVMIMMQSEGHMKFYVLCKHIETWYKD
jgi:hypothetical protein